MVYIEKEKQLEFIDTYRQDCSIMSDEDLKEFHFWAGHDMYTSDDTDENIYDRIVYDCACVAMNKRGLYQFSKFDYNILERVSGDFDYNNLDDYMQKSILNAKR